MTDKGRSYEHRKYSKKRNNDKLYKTASSIQQDYSFDQFLSDIGNQEMQRLFENGLVQAKLNVSRPGDASEQEADKIANAIVSGGSAQVGNIHKTPPIQKKASDSGVLIPSSTEAKIGSLKGKGSPLNKGLKDYFEPRFGTDLGNLRIHTDSGANRLSQAIHAKAFTHGNDIAFAQGQYQPGTTEGKKLLAHELVHTVQQGEGIRRDVIQRDEDSATQSQQEKFILGIDYDREQKKVIFDLNFELNIKDAKIKKEILDVVSGREYCFTFTIDGLKRSPEFFERHGGSATMNLYLKDEIDKIWFPEWTGCMYFRVVVPKCVYDVATPENFIVFNKRKEIDFRTITDDIVAKMTDEQKVNAAIARANIPQGILDELGDLRILAAAMVITCGVLIGLAATGVGAIAEAIAFVLLLLGAVLSGAQIVSGIGILVDFYSAAKKAKTVKEIDAAGKMFQEAIAKIGLGTIFLILSFVGGKSIKGKLKSFKAGAKTVEMKQAISVIERLKDVKFLQNVPKNILKAAENVLKEVKNIDEAVVYLKNLDTISDANKITEILNSFGNIEDGLRVLMRLDSEGIAFINNSKSGVKIVVNILKNNNIERAIYCINMLNKAKGLIGSNFENFLVELKSGSGSFKLQGREFDGRAGNTWWEAKSGNYWNNNCQPGAGFNKFKSDMGQRLAIAKSEGATLELYSNTPIPDFVEAWLFDRGIPFYEF